MNSEINRDYKEEHVYCFHSYMNSEINSDYKEENVLIKKIIVLEMFPNFCHDPILN
jgi:hypothetical protein